MKLKDATSVFGSVGILLPLILIFLIATDATYACPGNGSRVGYRTRTTNTRTVPVMGTTVITYRGPASYRGCSDNMVGTRAIRYVPVRAYRSPARYVAVGRAGTYYPVRRTRYIVRNDDIDYAPRQVVVRRQPASVESRTRYIAVDNGALADASRYVAIDRYRTDTGTGTRYVAVRSGYRTGNGIVSYIDVNDAPRYVAVRRPVYDTQTRYVAVRNVDGDHDVGRTRYVAVSNARNGCDCADELQSSLDEVETVSPRHVVVKSDYLAGTQEVIVPQTSYDDTAYVRLPSERVNRTYTGYTNAAYLDNNGEYYVPASYAVSPRTATISYVPTYDDNDFDYQANLDTDDAAYVAAGHIEDACLSRVAVQAPMELHTRAVNYVPIEYVNYNTSLSGSGAAYIVNGDTASEVSYVPVDDDDDITYVDAGTNYIAAADVSDNCSCPAIRTIDNVRAASTVSYVPVSDVEDIDVDTVSYVPVDNGTDMSTVSYVPAYDVADINTTTVSYVPARDTNVESVSYLPADSVDYVDTAGVVVDESPMSLNSVDVVPVYAADSSTVLVEEANSDLVGGQLGTQRVAGRFGYRDGFEDGQEAALERDAYHPENSGDYKKATEGYEDEFGDKDVYKDAYRSSYLDGYNAGFTSVTGSA